MQKPTRTKLSLHTQTLRRLDAEHLVGVRGGAWPDTYGCSETDDVRKAGGEQPDNAKATTLCPI